jgi:hypothetical protein
MKDLIIEASHSTPEVNFSVAKGVLKIKGICTPENPKMFFDPVMEKLIEFQKEARSLVIEIYLDYFNSGSSKSLLNLFIEASKHTTELKIIWISEDEELKESGVILEEITGLKFEYIDKKGN